MIAITKPRKPSVARPIKNPMKVTIDPRKPLDCALAYTGNDSYARGGAGAGSGVLSAGKRGNAGRSDDV